MLNLPVISLFEETYSIDCRLRQLSNVADPQDTISFEEFEASLMSAVMSISRNGGIDHHKELYEHLMNQAREYDKAVASLPSSSFVNPTVDTYSGTSNSNCKKKRHLRIV